MIAGYQGHAPVTDQVLPFALLGLLGAACATPLALATHAIRTRRARLHPDRQALLVQADRPHVLVRARGRVASDKAPDP